MFQGSLMTVHPHDMQAGNSSILYYSLLDQAAICGDIPGTLQGLTKACGTNRWIDGWVHSFTVPSDLRKNAESRHLLICCTLSTCSAQKQDTVPQHPFLSNQDLPVRTRGLSNFTHTAFLERSPLYVCTHTCMQTHTHTFFLGPFKSCRKINSY